MVEIVTSSATTTEAAAVTATTINNTNATVADLLVSFAEQNSYLYFNTHSQLRELIKQELLLNNFNRQDPLQLVSELYVPAVIKEYNNKRILIEII